MTDAVDYASQQEQQLQQEQQAQNQQMDQNRQVPQPGIPVTQTMSTSAGPYAQMDPEAQAEVQRELNLRVAHDSFVPFTPPEVPSHYTPNDIVQWASGHGTVGGGGLAGEPGPGGEITYPPPIDTPPEPTSSQMQKNPTKPGS